MGLVDVDKLRANYEGLARDLAVDPASGLVRPAVTARLVSDVTVESTFVQYDRDFRFVSDEATSRGGQEMGPSPMRYFLSGLAFCLVGWYAKGSAVSGCQVDGLELDLRTLLDMRGEHAVGGLAPHPTWLIAEARVSSPSTQEAVLAMIDWGDARCPLASLVRTAVPIHGRVIHNGAVIRNDVPTGLE
jgi:uncharacterized OsmC-like protein